MVQQHVTALAVDGHLAGYVLEAEGHVVGAAVVRAGQDAQEPVARRRGVDVDGERDRRPHVEVRTRLVVGVPADA